jgi:DNA (cytosine-5)-methyltransferase 1
VTGLIVDLFAGGGGASEGIFQATGRHPDIAINHDPDAILMHSQNHAPSKHYCEDVFAVSPREACAGRPVDLMWVSPSCTHFSAARGGATVCKQERSLAWVAVRWAREVRPRTIVLENVREFETWGPLLRSGEPDPAKSGETFRQFVCDLEFLGYTVAWKVLNAADYGAATSRKRLFLIARCDGLPVKWPAPSHEGRWLSAASIIDTTIPVPSIFTRKKPLAPATCRRIAVGIQKFVLNNPFIMDLQVGDGRRRASIVAAFMAKHYGGVVGIPLSAPLGTITTRDHHALVAVSLSQFNGQSIGSSVGKPMPTLMAKPHHALVAAHLVKFYGTSQHGAPVTDPLPTITAGGGHHFGLVATRIDGENYAITDIGMRFLHPRELANAQGFPGTYVLTGTKTRQIHLIGNSVCPPMAAAIVRELVGTSMNQERKIECMT